MKIKTKKGSYIMEAAIVLPMIILVTVTAVLIIMFFYTQMVEQSRLHITLRSEAGMLTEQTVYHHVEPMLDGAGAEIYTKKSAMGGSVYGKKYLVMANKGILDKKGTFPVEGSCYATDGAEYVRYCNLVKGVTNGTDEE